jgi:hypothetical protein
MQDLISTLDEIIKLDFRYSSESGSYQFKEPKISSYPITRVKTDGKTACYTFDVEKLDVFPFFQNTAGLKKVCDYILFCIHEDKVYVFLCELKSKQQDVEKAAMKQLKAAKIFVEFLIETARRYKRQKFPVTYRALIFSLSNAPRFSTNVKNDLKYQKGQSILFKHLRAGEECNLEFHCHP